MKQQVHLRKLKATKGVKLKGFRFHPGDFVIYKRKKYVVKNYGNKSREYFLKDLKTGEVVEKVSEIMLRYL